MMTAKGTNLLLGAAVLLIIAVTGSNAIMCYHCNSAYDPRCADPFNSFSLGIINCSMAPVPDHVGSMGIERATLCRKTTQKVYGKVRVVRGCGYITDDRDDGTCAKRSGTHDVFALYCACTTDLCNSSDKVFSKHQIVFGILAAILGSYANQFIQRQL
ncbi:unnamed protein product [Chironomus riparius]|uniref:Protein sleepless n=1 Tax=Chironomus riparius TaxID=315576 RepID=A0A9N9S7I2_9DIPT|nr:unnamed protein product [Chironomus riparius]